MGCGDEKDNRGTTEPPLANDVSASHDAASRILTSELASTPTPTKPLGNAVCASPRVKHGSPQVRVPCAASGQGTVAVNSPAPKNPASHLKAASLGMKKRKRPPALSISNGARPPRLRSPEFCPSPPYALLCETPHISAPPSHHRHAHSWHWSYDAAGDGT